MTTTTAFAELQSIRNELASGHADTDTLQARVDAVGQWAARQNEVHRQHAEGARRGVFPERQAGGRNGHLPPHPIAHHRLSYATPRQRQRHRILVRWRWRFRGNRCQPSIELEGGGVDASGLARKG